MTFEEAEGKFRELQARVQRGEAISRAEYEDQVSRLAVQDQFGVLWEINPRTGKWMYFDGAEWVSGAPPGRETSTVIPLSSLTPKPGGQTTQPSAPTTPPQPMPTRAPMPTARPTTPVSARPAPATRAPTAMQPTRAPARPVPARQAPPPGQPQRGGRSPLSMFGPGREWIPLAIAAGVLLVCALLLGGAALVLNSGVLGTTAGATPSRTATRVGGGLPTGTPTTRVALPTQPPPTATPAPVIAKVTPNTLNVRAAPDTKTGKVISTLKKDAQVTLIARSVDALWYQINLASGQQGWISAELVTIAGGDPNTLPQAGPGAPPAPKPQPAATPATKPYP
ncbi:MAG: SH3 domain-containing protein [Chloroflexi bacterium]|nr:SH3 domain-containing protein [Chloroflexota bacterium]